MINQVYLLTPMVQVQYRLETESLYVQDVKFSHSGASNKELIPESSKISRQGSADTQINHGHLNSLDEVGGLERRMSDVVSKSGLGSVCCSPSTENSAKLSNIKSPSSFGSSH